MKNSILTIKFKSKKYTYDVNWTKRTIEEGEDIADEIFFSSDPVIQNLFLNEEVPEMTVSLKRDSSITSPVIFDSTAEIIYPLKSISDIIP